MAVAAVGVVGDDDVGPQLADDRDERADRLAGSASTNRCRCPRRRARHPRVAPPARAAEEDRLVDAQLRQRRGQFADAVATELIGAVDGELRPALADHLALLAERARHDLHLRAPRAT